MPADHAQVKRKQQREQLSSTEGAQKAQLSKRLVEIQTDVDLPPVRQAILLSRFSVIHADMMDVHTVQLPACDVTVFLCHLMHL